MAGGSSEVLDEIPIATVAGPMTEISLLKANNSGNVCQSPVSCVQAGDTPGWLEARLD
jgi:hypothetical protein